MWLPCKISCLWDSIASPKPEYRIRVPYKTDKLILWVDNDLLIFSIWYLDVESQAWIKEDGAA